MSVFFVRTAVRSYTTTSASSADLLRLLQLSIRTKSLKQTQQSHAQVLTSGLVGNSYLATKIISAYAACGHPCQSKLVFGFFADQNVDVCLWNSLINAYVKNLAYSEAFSLFSQMCRSNETLVADDYTLATLSKVAGECRDLVAGKLVHSVSVTIGFIDDNVLANSLMSMYSKCGALTDARKLFDEMPERNIGSWNVLIAGYVGSTDSKIWEFVRCMQNEGLKPDAFTVSSILPLCGGGGGGGADAEKYDHGRELHCYILRNELDLLFGADIHLGSCLIDMYSRVNRVDAGRHVFDGMKCRNIYAWTAMINGYVQDAKPEEALNLFREMQVTDGIHPNRVSVVSVVPACSMFSGLTTLREIHGYVIRRQTTDDVPVCNALIDNYSKCGNLTYARRVFGSATAKDAISWSSLISGYGLHGKGEEAISLYKEMLSLRIKPDAITIVGVLSACGRSGLVAEGLHIYNSAINDCEIEPTVEICSCVVDLLGRSNQLDRALRFINDMPVEVGPSVWGVLLSNSIAHENNAMRDLAYSSLIQLEPSNPSNYVSLSNLHASSSRWDIVAGVRRTMKEKGLKKEGGCSWITVNGKTNCFYVADKAHPCSSAIYEMLHDLILGMKGNVWSAVCEI